MNGQAARPGKTRLMALGLTSLVVLIVSAGAVSLALFIDQETVPGTFSSGTIVLDDVKIDGLTLTTSNMMPGASVTDDVVVENDGSSQLRYAVSAASTSVAGPSGGVLNTVLLLTVKSGVTTCTTAGFATDGTVVRASIALGATTVVIGDPAQGAQTGDRNLAAAASETLCFQVSLPIGTGNTYQGATTTTTFTFDAEQTQNN